MLIKEVDYQKKAIDKLMKHTEDLLPNGEENSLIIFKSPTGSGKTVMVAQYIRTFLRQTEEDVCFVWISIGKGDLHAQSKKKLESIFEGFPEITLLHEDYFGSRKEIPRKEVVVVNWEKIRDRDRQTGEWKNTLMRDGERMNFRDVLANTHEAGRKIILIIDESHIGRGSQRTQEIKEEIRASLIIEMTATPVFPANFQDHVEDGKAGYVKINIQEVIDEQMIKKKLVINEGLVSQEQASMDIALLELAIQKRMEIQEKLLQEESRVNPLVIIQLPNGEEGELKKEIILQALRDKGIGTFNRKVAIWLDQEKIHLESITNPYDTVEFLLFKQAVDTGWDCPRSYILLKYRETTSETFERQTLGRILRMPEQKHYEDDTLNKAYVFTDYIGNVLEIIDEEFDYPDENIDDVPLQAQSGLPVLSLLTQKVKKKKKDIVKESLNQSFQEVIQAKGLRKFEYTYNQELLWWNRDIQQLTEKVIAEMEVDVKEILEQEQILGTEAEFFLDEFKTQRLFDRLIQQHSRTLGTNRHHLYTLLKENVYSLLAYYIEDIYQLRNIMIDAQRLFILNYSAVFLPFLSEVIALYRDQQAGEVVQVTVGESYWYQLPERDNVNSETYEKVDVEKYYYQTCYLEKNRTQPERVFEQYIQERIDDILYWVKNGNQGSKYFSLPYQVNGETHNFYPDYLIYFADHRIGLFETKDAGDGSPETKAKAEALYQYLQQQNEKGETVLIGGIVADFGTHDTPYLKVNTNATYTTNQAEWTALDDLYRLSSSLK